MIIKFAFCNQLGSHDSLIWYKACQDKKPECFELLLPILAKKKIFFSVKVSVPAFPFTFLSRLYENMPRQRYLHSQIANNSK